MYQAFDELLQLSLGCAHSFLRADHSDEFLVFVLCSGEDDSGSSAVTNFTDVSTTFPDEKLVVFWLGMQLGSETLGLLKKNNKFALNEL